MCTAGTAYSSRLTDVSDARRNWTRIYEPAIYRQHFQWLVAVVPYETYKRVPTMTPGQWRPFEKSWALRRGETPQR